MTPIFPHIQPKTELDAIKLQMALARNIKSKPLNHTIHTIAGIDVAYEEHEDGKTTAHAGIVILDANTLLPIEVQTASIAVDFPYISGLFAFRELPAVIAAAEKLSQSPDLFVCDAHGVSHVRGVGMASHFGLLFDCAVIGCAKTPFAVSTYTVADERGSTHELTGMEAAVLRTQDSIKPVYVSVGHNIDLRSSIDWILHLTQRFRLPETTRYADQLVNAIRKQTEPDWLKKYGLTLDSN